MGPAVLMKSAKSEGLDPGTPRRFEEISGRSCSERAGALPAFHVERVHRWVQKLHLRLDRPATAPGLTNAVS